MFKPPFRIKNMMPGIIMGWPYSIESIPSGWHLCDGTAGTVDLRNCYLACAGDAYTPMQSFGDDNQAHAFTGDGHNHQYVVGTDIPVGTGERLDIDSANVTGTTDEADNRPQTKAICWIQKL
ncbi:unnamed protein product [marine sediment metagenome]|uniref:Phage tail collar domain-containing protein n=1 Tax=marine sediment metagenome TaxID=412755 RepID=X1IP01_9ZZZZ